MKKAYFFVLFIVVAICITVCCIKCKPKYLEVNTETLQEKIYDPSATKYKVLNQSTVLYLDHSTCVIDARQNSKVFNALRPQLGQYSDTLRLIKGGIFETIPLKRSDNKVFEVLQTIEKDIPDADILKAVEQICNGNQQAILITDCEFIRDGLVHDQDPYLSEPLKFWLKNGHSVYVVVEPYKERNRGRTYDKKRFYFIFTDDRVSAPISHNMLNEIEPLLQTGLCKLFKLTNSDISIQKDSKKMVMKDLTFTIEEKEGFEFISIDDSWEDIRDNVMKLNKYGEPVKGETEIPIIENLTFNDGENYIIGDVQIKATNITSQYMALEDSSITPGNKDMSEGFKLDEKALKEHKLNVLLTDKIFSFLNDEYGGNLIRLDFIVKKIGLKDHDANMFAWPSLYNNEDAICVSKSIDNVLKDIEIVPTSDNRKVIHTVFIRTGAYK